MYMCMYGTRICDTPYRLEEGGLGTPKAMRLTSCTMLAFGIIAAAGPQRASELQTWPHTAHADDIEDIAGPGPHLPPVLNGMQPHGGPAGIT